MFTNLLIEVFKFLTSTFSSRGEKYIRYAKFNGTKGPINCVSFNHNGELLASGGDDETIRIWDIPRRKCSQIIEDHSRRWGQITCLVWLGGRANEDLQPIAFGTGRGLVIIYRRSRTDTPMLELANTRAFEPSDPVEAITFDPIHSRLAVSSHHGQITLYELGKHGTMMKLWTNTVYADKKVSIARAIEFYEDYKKLLIFVLETGEMICRDTESGKEDWRKLLKSGIGHANICPQEKLLLIENLSKGFDLYDLPRSSPSYTFAIQTTKRCIKVGVFAEDSSVVACGSDHGKIYIFSTASPIPLQIVRQAGASTAIQALDAVTTTDTHFIASGSSTASSDITIWEKKIKKANISVEEAQTLNRIWLSVNILILLVLVAATWNLWMPFVFRTASQNLMKMSQALGDRLPPPESGLEYAPRNTFRDEDWVEGDKGEHGASIRRQARRATPYTQPNRGNVPVTAPHAESPPTDITHSDTDGSDVEESSRSSPKISKPTLKIEAKPKEAPKPEDDELSSGRQVVPPKSELNTHLGHSDYTPSQPDMYV